MDRGKSICALLLVGLLFLSCATKTEYFMREQSSTAPLKAYTEKKPKRVLVLSGGAFYGAFELGVILYLIKELGMKFDIVCGTSVGALNAAMIVRGNIGEFEAIWRSLDSRDDIFRPGILENVIAKGGLYGIEPLAELVDRHVDVERLRKSDMRLLVGVVCLETGEFMLIDQNNPHIKSFILASTSVPGMTPAIKIDGKHYVDGGLRYVMPVRQIMNLDVKEIIMVSAFSLEDKVAAVESKNLKRYEAGDYRKITHFTERALQIVMHQLLWEPIDYAFSVAPYKGIDVKLIQPDRGFFKKGAFEFDREEIRKGISKASETQCTFGTWIAQMMCPSIF
jgi:predicted acylesterase/phospholipase RssA